MPYQYRDAAGRFASSQTQALPLREAVVINSERRDDGGFTYTISPTPTADQSARLDQIRRMGYLTDGAIGTLISAGFSPCCGTERCTSQHHWTDSEGMTLSGYDSSGYNSEGYDRNGYDRNGLNRSGYDLWGYNSDGYNSDGYNSDGYNSDGYDSAGYNCEGFSADGGYSPLHDQALQEDDDSDSGYCYDCDSRRCRCNSGLYNYSYTPNLKFRGESPPWYGMEIEVTTDHPDRVVREVSRGGFDNLIYCKEDGSIDGAELVTHPMSYQWAMQEFPWDILPKLSLRADATVIPQENGIHIHVSRDGFTDPAHMFRWMKFWYRNPTDIQRIARRTASSWAAFGARSRQGQAQHVKRGKPGYNHYDDATLNSRYEAINTTNDATLEVRVFASTLRPKRAQAALQLVAGTVEYTRSIRASDVCQRHGWDWQAFTSWAGKSGEYPALMSENRVRR